MLKLFNTLSRKKENFKPQKKTISLYTCGPTVYDLQHIGNLRSAIFGDILRRVLEFNDFNVKQITNITDIEDKIFARAKKEKKDFRKITEPYTKLYLKDLERLNIKKAYKYPKATGNIKEMISFIEKLLENEFAYKSKDGSVYFDISKFKRYGRLARLKKVNLKHGARVSSDEYDKENVGDFVLWRAKKPGEPSWKSPFGEGRPGWHIECSVLSTKYLGDNIDIHTGGVDLIFPHHENEIAQSEAVTEGEFVKYWLHGEHLQVNGRKMAKSLRNFYTLGDLEKKEFNPLVYRYFVLGAHYRSKLNFTWTALGAAESALYNLYHEIAFLKLSSDDKKMNVISRKRYKSYDKQFLQAVNDDLNLPRAMSVVWNLLHDKLIPPKNRRELLFKFDKVLGLELKDADKFAKSPANVKKLVNEREKFRINKQFIKSDSLRVKIEKLGYIVEDTPKGPFIWPTKI